MGWKSARHITLMDGYLGPEGAGCSFRWLQCFRHAVSHDGDVMDIGGSKVLDADGYAARRG